MCSASPQPDAEHWLGLLRDGSDQEQQLARTELGLLLENRGLLDEAAEAFRANVEAGVADRRPYERLAAIARQRDDPTTEAWALRALANLLDPTGTDPPPVAPVDAAMPETVDEPAVAAPEEQPAAATDRPPQRPTPSG